MPVKILSQEDRTGEVWYPRGFKASEEAFVVTGPPSVISHGAYGRVLIHPVVHLCSGLYTDRQEWSQRSWNKSYIRLNR